MIEEQDMPGVGFVRMLPSDAKFVDIPLKPKLVRKAIGKVIGDRGDPEYFARPRAWYDAPSHG